MAESTAIEWTDATWNPVTGCSVVSPGCTNCYAMKLAGTRLQHHPSRAGLTIDTKAGPVWTGEVRFNEEWLDQPLRWHRPRRIFVCAHGDLFHESVPDEWIDRVFAVMALAARHTFQVLTKRAGRMSAYLTKRGRWQTIAGAAMPLFGDETAALAIFGARFSGRHPLPNVWLGVSVEDQARADERIPDLLATPAAVRFLSCEPLLGPIDLCRVRGNLAPIAGYIPGGSTDHQPVGLDWIIAGGESGPGARPMHPGWARTLRDQCAAAGVPFFFKQWGEFRPYCWRTDNCTRTDPTGEYGHPGADSRHVLNEGESPGPDNIMIPVGKKAAGRLLDGAEHNGMPA